MQTHILGKINYQTLEFEFEGQPVYCIIMKELYCEDEDLGCDLTQLTHSGNYHIIITTNTGTYQDTIFKDEDTWDSIYEEPEFDDDDNEENDFEEEEKPEDYADLIEVIGAKIEASQITL